MNSIDYESLKHFVSVERLKAYEEKLATNDHKVIFQHYLWNIELSKSLYPLLQNIEVALRNAIHKAILDHYSIQIEEYHQLRKRVNPFADSNHYDGEAWFELPELLDHSEKNKVKSTIHYLKKKKSPVTTGKIIAELNFNFWSKLFDSKYEQILWRKIIKQVFPHAPSHERTRKSLSLHFNRFTDLRNRIFHHEPIYYKENLPLLHDQILQIIGWINPDLEKLTLKSDTFEEVYKNGLGKIIL